MRYLFGLCLLCGSLCAAEGVTVSVNEDTKVATITITVDATDVYAKQTTKKDRTLHLLDAARKVVDRAQKSVAYETAKNIDDEAAKAIADQTVAIQAEVVKIKAALPVSDVKEKAEAKK